MTRSIGRTLSKRNASKYLGNENNTNQQIVMKFWQILSQFGNTSGLGKILGRRLMNEKVDGFWPELGRLDEIDQPSMGTSLSDEGCCEIPKKSLSKLSSTSSLTPARTASRGDILTEGGWGILFNVS